MISIKDLSSFLNYGLLLKKLLRYCILNIQDTLGAFEDQEAEIRLKGRRIFLRTRARQKQSLGIVPRCLKHCILWDQRHYLFKETKNVRRVMRKRERERESKKKIKGSKWRLIWY